MKKYTTVEEQIEYGLDTISSDRLVEIPLRDLMYVFQTLGEFIRFFHQPLHYQKLEDINKFLGSVEQGAYSALSKSYYEVLRNHIPEDIEEAFDDGERFENPNPPYYYKENE